MPLDTVDLNAVSRVFNDAGSDLLARGLDVDLQAWGGGSLLDRLRRSTDGGSSWFDLYTLSPEGGVVRKAEWNDGATTFTGWKLNVTATAFASGSLLMDLQKDGVSKFSFREDGTAFAAAVGSATGGFSVLTFNSVRFGFGTGSAGSNAVQFRSDGAISFAATTSIGGASDLILARDAANTLALRNSTNAQTLNIYNTYTDASNYERGFLKWNSNVLEIGTEAAGTGTWRRIDIISDDLRFLDRSTFAAYLNSNSFSHIASGGRITVDNSNNGGFWMNETTSAPSATANYAKVFAEDNGSGKTRLMVQFGTGAAQQIAIEP